MTRRRNVIGVAALIGLIVVAVVAFAPGGSDDDGPLGGLGTLTPAGPVAQAAEHTASVRGIRFTERGRMTMPELDGRRIEYAGGGEMDMRGQRARIHVDMTDMYDEALQAGGAEDLGPRDGWQMDMVLDEKMLYMRWPALMGDLPGDRSWAMIDLEEAFEDEGVDSSLLDVGLGSSDPTQMLGFLRAASDDERRLGTETIRGVETTHYRATVELRKYPELVPEEDRESAERSIDKVVKSYGTDEIEMDVWIDRKKLIHRLRSEEFNDLDGSDLWIEDTLDFYAHGRAVTIELPPEDDVADLNASLPSFD